MAVLAKPDADIIKLKPDPVEDPASILYLKERESVCRNVDSTEL